MMGVILFVAGFFSYRYLNANYQRDSRENQGRLARITKLYFQRDWPRLAGQIDADCKRLFANRTMRLTVIADDGRVLGDSQARAATMENHRTDDRPEVLQALKGQAGRDIRSSETLGSQFRYFAEPIEKGGKILGVVRLAMPVRAIAEGRNVIRNALTWAAMVAVGVAVVIAGMLSWMWHKPIRQITETARAIAAGNLSAKAPAGGSDELAQMYSTFFTKPWKRASPLASKSSSKPAMGCGYSTFTQRTFPRRARTASRFCWWFGTSRKSLEPQL